MMVMALAVFAPVLTMTTVTPLVRLKPSTRGSFSEALATTQDVTLTGDAPVSRAAAGDAMASAATAGSTRRERDLNCMLDPLKVWWGANAPPPSYVSRFAAPLHRQNR